MGIWTARALILFILYGQAIEFTCTMASFGDYTAFWPLLLHMINPLVISIEDAVG